MGESGVAGVLKSRRSAGRSAVSPSMAAPTLPSPLAWLRVFTLNSALLSALLAGASDWFAHQFDFEARLYPRVSLRGTAPYEHGFCGSSHWNQLEDLIAR